MGSTAVMATLNEYHELKQSGELLEIRNRVRLVEIDRFIADCQARGKAARLRASQLMRELTL